MGDVDANRDMNATINALFEISNAVNNTDNLYELYESIHVSLNKILNLENFAIAIYHEEKDSMTFPYFVDEIDTELGEIFEISKKQSLSARVINAGKPLLFYAEDIMNMSNRGGRIASHNVCKVWAGAPLKIKGHAFGALLVQSYRSRDAFNPCDLDLLNSVAEFIAVSIERKQVKEEKLKMETQLQQARKMEAIGALAGGVAHDLNNVLTAQVAYPELILMDLPDDSPIREFILRIQESGQKAAAIVQDLLTLARRGVVITDVINLNQIVDSYLCSPEYDRLKGFHSQIKIKSILDMGLLNIMGSQVHLFKTIMNLVNNAAEAMPTGGEISISTKNRYIDQPIRGYDSIKEGDYAVIQISDTGTGIAPSDIERIFEPFYTKKKMGKSGTGLGMAVVWGTIKDHNGYIDVQSEENDGTTLTLYFPVTRKEMVEQPAVLSIEEYLGNEESILVVDDIDDQRKIASDLLKRLGYTVISASSGENAVQYMKENSVDLIVLDMIMNQGIDGCETYKRILKLHPKQKAIISSGFSETGRVKEAQQLGAGEYIKKPYTLEKLGLAVKKELEKIQNRST